MSGLDPLATPGLGTYWETQGQDPPEPVLQDTDGYGAPIPYQNLPGSDVGTESPLNELTAESLFPTYNGTTLLLPKPKDPNNPEVDDPAFLAEFNKEPTDLNVNVFLQWHSAHQLEYIAREGTDIPGTSPPQKSVVIGISPNTVTAVVSADGFRLYIVENLQKRDFAIMPPADQFAIAQTPAFTGTTGLGAAFGLTIDKNLILDGNDSLPVGDPQKLGLKDIKAIITDLFPGALPPYNDDNPFPSPEPTKGLMTLSDRNLFIQQIDNIINKVNQMSVFSMTDIINQATAISTRFERAFRFAQVPAETGDTFFNPSNPDPNQWRGVISLDGGETVKQGYKVFIEQEKQILAFENARLALAGSGMIQDKKLDVPTLVFLFQLHYNLTVEAKVVAETQEINQQNALLKTYAEMQRIINDTIKAFDTGDPNQIKGVLGLQGRIPIAGTATQAGASTAALGSFAKVISMFENPLGTSFRHPLEILRGVTRPLDDMFHNDDKQLNGFKKSHWDTFATELADAVTLLNQESQIKMNDINSMDKQKNRHFDLANSALSKLHDMLQNIARAG